MSALAAAQLAGMFDRVELAAVALADQDTLADTVSRVGLLGRAGTRARLAVVRLAYPGCSYYS